MSPPRLPDRIVDRLKHPLVAAAAVQLGVKVAQEVYKLRCGEMSVEQFKQRLGRHVGALAGTATGAVAGAWMGSVMPGVGTILGAFGGGLAGDLLGEYATRRGADALRADEADQSAAPVNVDSSLNGSPAGSVVPPTVDARDEGPDGEEDGEDGRSEETPDTRGSEPEPPAV